MRFPDRITRRRQGIGAYNQYGEFIEGAITETPFQASVQPITLEDDPTSGGAQFKSQLKVYIPESNALLGAFEDRSADQIILDGVIYKVESSQSWRGHHTKAILIREP